MVVPFDFYLVSRGGSGGECRGTYDSGAGAGLGYTSSCIHSGTIKTSGDLPTTWYNYALASAGTITGSSNSSIALQSVCPKGWSLPDNTQIDSQRDVNSFFPVLGGGYGNTTLYNETTRGFWWGSMAYNGAWRYNLRYNGSLYISNGDGRSFGFYVRCVQAS